jgi:hypothetical protein
MKEEGRRKKEEGGGKRRGKKEEGGKRRFISVDWNPNSKRTNCIRRGIKLHLWDK